MLTQKILEVRLRALTDLAKDTQNPAKPRYSANPSQAEVDVPLSAIPVFDSVAGLYNRHLNSNSGICLR